MNTIKEDNINEIIIKNSRFIALLFKVNNIDEVNYKLLKVKSIYSNATHYPYAYIIDNNNHYSDDEEPSGTAGVPILNVLTKNNLNHVLCVVVRYFGGIKLGAGGLNRAYSKSVIECLKLNSIKTLKKGKEIIITFNYESVKNIDYILKNEIIKNKFYDSDITYTIHSCDLSIINALTPLVKTVEINKDIYIED